jgi:hypothetical protein
MTSKLFLRICALYLLLTFVGSFILVTANILLGGSLFGEAFGSVLARYPYAFDFEAMFAVLFLVWAVYLWRAADNIKQNALFISFSGWALLTHGLVFIALALFAERDTLHFLRDSIPMIFFGSAQLFLLKRHLHG